MGMGMDVAEAWGCCSCWCCYAPFTFLFGISSILSGVLHLYSNRIFIILSGGIQIKFSVMHSIFIWKSFRMYSCHKYILRIQKRTAEISFLAILRTKFWRWFRLALEKLRISVNIKMKNCHIILWRNGWTGLSLFRKEMKWCRGRYPHPIRRQCQMCQIKKIEIPILGNEGRCWWWCWCCEIGFYWFSRDLYITRKMSIYIYVHIYLNIYICVCVGLFVCWHYEIEKFVRTQTKNTFWHTFRH